MNAPTFVSATSTAYTTLTNSATLTLSTQPGDRLIVVAAFSDGVNTGHTVTGNGTTFTQQAVALATTNSSLLWTGTDANGGSNWTLTYTRPGPSVGDWGFTCYVFRNSNGFGNAVQLATGAPLASLSSTTSNSAFVILQADDTSSNGSTRVWSTADSVTPSAGNGLEKLYYLDAGLQTIFSAYYDNIAHVGTYTVGLTSPNSQQAALVAVEVLGYNPPQPTITAWLTA